MSIQPAIRVFDKTYVGNNHYEALAKSGVSEVAAENEGFLIDDVFYTREETYILTGGVVCLETGMKA